MAPLIGRRLRKGVATTAVAAAAMAALTASQAPGFADSDRGEDTTSEAKPPPGPAIDGGSPYRTELPRCVRRASRAPPPTCRACRAAAEPPRRASRPPSLTRTRRPRPASGRPTPAAICPGNCWPRSARSSPVTRAVAPWTPRAPPSSRYSARCSTAAASP
ncbi:hypothetical protein NKH77_13595 [Streptomyces sp. M19]